MKIYIILVLLFLFNIKVQAEPYFEVVRTTSDVVEISHNSKTNIKITKIYAKNGDEIIDFLGYKGYLPYYQEILKLSCRFAEMENQYYTIVIHYLEKGEPKTKTININRANEIFKKNIIQDIEKIKLINNLKPFFEVVSTNYGVSISCYSDREFYITEILKYFGDDSIYYSLGLNSNYLVSKYSQNILLDEYSLSVETKNINKLLKYYINIKYFYNGEYYDCQILITKGVDLKIINESHNTSFVNKNISNIFTSYSEYKRLKTYDFNKKIKVGEEKKQIKPTKALKTIDKNITELVSTGTGFAISSDGYVITNHHVIKDATELKIRGLNGNMKKSYKATVVSKDENNDLAILKIDDTSFTGFGIVPINIVQKSIDVGSSIFVLGYPMVDAMGDEIKLTDGKISSRTGYQGDVSSYQISAPIQPGNSGGPLFDEEGNLIGITSSGILSANNVGYAIKTSYLMNMFDALSDYPNLTKTNTIAKKKLPEKIKILQKFIFIIENYQ